MQLQQCSNPACGNFYELSEFGHDRPAPAKKQAYQCPYCGTKRTGKTSGAFITRKCDQPQTLAASSQPGD